MVWVRIDDHFDQNPKIAAVGPLGIALWVTGLAYCNRNLTDGFIPWTTARALLAWEYLEPDDPPDKQRVQRIGVSCGHSGDDVDSSRVIELLLMAGLWDIDDRGGYVVHDYDQYQPLKEQVEVERKASAERTARHRANSRGSNTGSNGVTHDVRMDVPVPDPGSSKELPEAPAARRSPTKRSGFKALTEEQRSAIDRDYADILNLSEEIEYALQHTAHGKCHDENLYLRHWLRGTRERLGTNGLKPQPKGDATHWPDGSLKLPMAADMLGLSPGELREGMGL